MAASRPSFKVTERTEFGARTTRRLRRTGFVPGVVYSEGALARPFQADAHSLALFVGEGHALFDLEIEGAGTVPVVIKEEQRHPVRGELMHLDCYEVNLNQAIEADVAIELSGTDDAPGVKEGGVLEHVAREITIEALPTDIPDELIVDVSAMEIGDTIQLDTVALPKGVTLAVDSPEEYTVATLNPPPVVELDEPEVEEETEVIGERDEGSEAGDAETGDGSDESDDGDEG